MAQRLRPVSAKRFLVDDSESTSSAARTRNVKGKKRIIDIDADDSSAQATGHELWADRFAPDASSLCVHKRKVEDVRRWLNEALHEEAAFPFRRILVLSGPAGAGKTATLRLLSQELDFDIQEYRSPDAYSEGLARHFTEFLARACAATALELRPAPLAGPSQPKRTKRMQQDRKIILVEDLPNLFSSTDTADAFASALTAYVTATRRTTLGVPLVIVVSEALARNDVSGENAALNEGRPIWQSSVTARTIIPADVLNSGRATEIKFNPVAPTLLKRALLGVLEKARGDARRQIKSEVFDLVIHNANGDIRSALNTLQFLLYGSDRGESELLEAPSTKSKGRKGKNSQKGACSSATIQLVTAREASLFLFHATGKVLYSKRWGEDEQADSVDNRFPPQRNPALPPHLAAWTRQPSKVDLEVRTAALLKEIYGDDVQALFADLPVDVDMFISYLHQNYTLFVNDIFQCEHVVGALSDADHLVRHAGTRSQQHPLADRHAFESGVRGLMLGLPAPVPRRQQRVFKSQQWEILRQRRETGAELSGLQQALARLHSMPMSGVHDRSFATDYAAYLSVMPTKVPQMFGRVRDVVAKVGRYRMPTAAREVLDEADLGSQLSLIPVDTTIALNIASTANLEDDDDPIAES